VNAWIGIDVSKLNLDVCLLRSEGKPLHKEFKNDHSGFSKLARWVKSLGVSSAHYCLEATGSYSDALAHFLAEAGEAVSVENPARIKHFGIGIGKIQKTDKADALTIATYCKMTSPSLWRLSAPEVKELVALLRRLQSLQELLNQEENRLKEPGLIKEVKRSLNQTVRFLKTEIQKLRVQIDEHVSKHPGLKADKELLESIPGIGPMAALWILAELPDPKQFSTAQAAAAYAGLAPQERRSGTSIKGKTRLSKAGKRHLRRALFMPAVSAKRYNPLVKDLYERLISRGLSKMAAIGACMRKLLMIAYGVLKSQKKFDATLSNAAS